MKIYRFTISSIIIINLLILILCCCSGCISLKDDYYIQYTLKIYNGNSTEERIYSSKDNYKIVIGSQNGCIYIWNNGNLEETLTGVTSVKEEKIYINN